MPQVLFTKASVDIGAFIPIVSAYDPRTNEGRIFFYDGMGARFESTEFGAAGSGSTQIRGVFDYIVKTKKPFHIMTRQEALKEALPDRLTGNCVFGMRAPGDSWPILPDTPG